MSRAWRRSGVPVNRDFCLLVDIGGEDTKISTIALAQAELYANAMNLKCSAGTGSLMDTLSALFGLPGVKDACAQAYAAPRAFSINATCAVFLMENARRLQAAGTPRDEILASANWAIVENMARSLWGQIELPRNAVVLLHGQTMLSEPLPLAVTDRLQSYLRAPAYAIVPPHPGHRACLGLVRTLVQAAPAGAVSLALDAFVDVRLREEGHRVPRRRVRRRRGPVQPDVARMPRRRRPPVLLHARRLQRHQRTVCAQGGAGGAGGPGRVQGDLGLHCLEPPALRGAGSAGDSAQLLRLGVGVPVRARVRTVRHSGARRRGARERSAQRAGRLPRRHVRPAHGRRRPVPAARRRAARRHSGAADRGLADGRHRPSA